MSILTNGSLAKYKLLHNGQPLKYAYHNSTVKLWSAANTVTYLVDTNISYTEEVEEGAGCLSPKSFIPAKTGWTFAGWRADNTASGEIYTTLNMGDSPLTLYAVFKIPVTVTCYNGSTTADNTTKYRYYNNGKTSNPSFTLSQQALSGWTPRGWSASTAGNGSITYNNDTSFTRSSDIILYGMYLRALTLSYKGNGATDGSVAAQSGIRYYNSIGTSVNPSFTLRANTFTRTGYTFVKWALQSADGTQYAPGATLSGTNDAIMYAVWKPSNITKTLIAGGNGAQSPTYLYNWYDSLYDLTNINTITFTVKYQYLETGSDAYISNSKYYYNTYRSIVGVSKDKSAFNASDYRDYGNHSNELTMQGTASITINVSGLKGSYYIGAAAMGYNSYVGVHEAVRTKSDTIKYSTTIIGITFN